MLRTTQLCKNETISALLVYRGQLLNDLYQLEMFLRNKLYKLYNEGVDNEHRIHLDSIYVSKTEYPYILGVEIVEAVLAALNVTSEQALEACNNALLLVKNTITSGTLLKYREFQEMEALKSAYDATFIAEEMIRRPKVSLVKYKASAK